MRGVGDESEVMKDEKVKDENDNESAEQTEGASGQVLDVVGSGGERAGRLYLERGPRRRRRSDAGVARIQARDVELLTYIGEQYAISARQLGELLGQVGERRVNQVRQRWRRAGWVETRPLLADHPPIIWLTKEGLRITELAERGYRTWSPTPGRLAHYLAVVDLRLYLEHRHPEREWISERAIARGQAEDDPDFPKGHRPDAVVRVDDRQVAIEVELTSKDKARSERIMRAGCEQYDAVWYFAAPAPARLLAQLARAHADEDLVLVHTLDGEEVRA